MENGVAIDRMGVYEFLERDGSCKKYCVAVGGEHRKFERYASIIILTEVESYPPGHGDSIGISLPVGDYWVNCSMVTYIRRDRIGNKIGKIGDKTRKKIAKMIGIEMGIIHQAREKAFEVATGEIAGQETIEEKYERLKEELKASQEEAQHWKQLYNGIVGALKQVNTAEVAP